MPILINSAEIRSHSISANIGGISLLPGFTIRLGKLFNNGFSFLIYNNFQCEKNSFMGISFMATFSSCLQTHFSNTVLSDYLYVFMSI